MKKTHPANNDDVVFDAPDDRADEDDHWFLPGPPEDDGDVPAAGRAQPEGAILADWKRAEGDSAAMLARVAGRVGALDERLRRAPEGWRHRLALIEAAELAWRTGDRITPDRLAQWIALRLAGVQSDAAALARVGWAVRRLTGGPGPEADLVGFLGRHETEHQSGSADRLVDRASNWLGLIYQARALHPITRACMGYHLWHLAGLGDRGGDLEAAVTTARVAAVEAKGVVFVPLAMGGAGGLRAGGPPVGRLARWLDGIDAATLAAMRHLDDVEGWAMRSTQAMTTLSGRTPQALLDVMTAWPMVSAPMAEALTGASRAAVQRNLAWMETRGLIREVTGQERFRMWKAAI